MYFWVLSENALKFHTKKTHFYFKDFKFLFINFKLLNQTLFSISINNT